MNKIIKIETTFYPKELQIIEDNLPYVFHHSYFEYLINQNYNCYIFIFKTNIFLPFATKRNKFINSAFLLYPPVSEDGRIDSKEEKECYNIFLNEILRKNVIDRVLPFIPLDVSNSFPDKSNFAKFGNVSLTLEKKTEDEIFSKFKASNRNIIRKAKKLNSYVKFGDKVFEDFYDIYKNTLKRQKLYYDSKESILSFYSSLKNNCLCAVSYSADGDPEAALLVPFTSYGGYSLYAGSKERLKVRGSVKYLHWEVILKLKRNNVKRFIFGGARVNKNKNEKYNGLKKFKMSFGGVLNEGFLWKIENSKLKISLYEKGVKAKLILKNQKYTKDIVEQINDN